MGLPSPTATLRRIHTENAGVNTIQEDKTIQRDRPNVSQTRRQQGNKKIRLQFKKKMNQLELKKK